MLGSIQRQYLLKAFRTSAFYVSVALAVAVWLGDSFIRAWFFGNAAIAEAFLTEMLNPGSLEFYSRLFVSIMILCSGALVGCRMALYKHKAAALKVQKTLMQEMINAQPECVKTVSRDGKLLAMNPAGLDIIEANSIEDVMNRCVYDLIAPEHREQFIEFNARVFRGEQASLTYDVLGLKGRRKSVDSHAVPLRNAAGEIIAHLGVTRDITAFKASQTELHKFSRAVEQCGSMVLITDVNGRITYVNPRLCQVTGYSETEFIGETPAILQSGAHGPEFYEELWQTIGAGEEWRGRIQNRCKNGDMYWAAMVISPVKDENGAILHFMCTQEDVTDSHDLAQKMEYQAEHCMLTGLVNRHAFERHMQELLEQARASKCQHAVLFCDMDQFKLINDSFGHAAGDQVLRQVSSLLKQNVREHDVVARLGGDEFALLIRECVPGQADRIAEDLRHAVEDFTFAWENNTFKLTLSIGAAVFDEFTPDINSVLSHADASCYVAKDQGRNRIHHYQEGEDDASRQGEFRWVAEIHKALEENQFTLYVQDIVALGADGADYYEVLIRYVDQEGVVIPPGAFMPAAERYGLTSKIDRWVLSQVCRLLAEELDPAINVSVNLSGLSVNDSGFLEFVLDCLAEHQIAPGRLCFEITETATITHLNEAANFIKEIKAAGCRFALDDFGSGLSSFGYLRSLPVDVVKIDGVFVKNICANPIELAMVKSINEIGHVMGKQTVAEFVENKQTAELLASIGVDYAQGYGISKPRPITELIGEFPAGEMATKYVVQGAAG